MLGVVREYLVHNAHMRFDFFMRQVLYHHVHGYYMKTVPMGRGGDFTTSPEISQIFGEIVALYLIHKWYDIGAPSDFILLELGSGSGTLMSDIIRVASKFPDFYAAMNIFLCEISPTLRSEQRQKLQGYDVTWCTDVDDLSDRSLIFIANEFFDALPVRQFMYSNGVWLENYVVLENDKLKVQFMLTDDVPDIVTNSRCVNNGAILEVCLDAILWMEKLSGYLSKVAGAGLIVDYGYLEPVYRDTLQSVKGHKYCSLTEYPGESDITAYVDFGCLCRVAQNLNIDFSTQMEFLLRLGASKRLAMLLQNANKVQCEQLQLGFDRIIYEMGTMFKVLQIHSA